jgi:hypothetical protein
MAALALERLMLPSVAVEMLWVEFIKGEGFLDFQ